MNSIIKKVVSGFSTLALTASMLVMPLTAQVAHAATAGGVYKTPDGTVWFVTKDMQKRPFTSAGAFLSYGFLSWGQVQDADSSVTNLPQGSFIAPQDGRIFCATVTKDSDVAGECSLITGSQKAAFTSEAVFHAQGFSFSRAFYGDSSFLAKTSNIDNGSAQHRPGVLINDAGTVRLIVNGGTWGVPSMDVFNSWGWSFADVVPANSADNLLSQVGIIPARMAGELVPTGTVNPPPPPVDNCDLDGNAGDITVSPTSTYSSEEVGEGEEEVPVMAFEVEADDSSDVAVSSVRVELVHTGNGSKRLNKYADEVSIWMGDEKLGESSVSSFTRNGDIYTKSINLDCAVIRGGDTEELSVAVSALNNIDSADLGEDWTVDVISVRFEDADGVFSTEDTDGDALDQTFTFEDFASAANVELRVDLNDDDADINESHIIDVDDNNTTKDQPILSFTLEARGDSDINVDKIPVNVDVTGAANIDDMISKISLWQGNNQIDTVSVGSGVGADKTYIFDDLDIDIDAGDTEEFMVKVDLKATSSALDEGDTISAQLSDTEVDAIDAEDESGDDLSTNELTGTAVGEAHAVYDNGIMVTFDSASATKTFTADDPGENDQGTFKINFTVTAFGDNDMRIDKSCEENDADTAGQGVEYTISNAGSNSTTCILTSSSNDSEDTANTFEIDRGNPRQFTLTVIATASADHFAEVALASINWGALTNDNNANYYTFNLNDYKTDSLFLRTLP